MTTYCCETCNKKFELKTDYVRHLKKKYKCKTVNEEPNDNLLINQNKEYKCVTCNKTFDYKSKLLIHCNNKFSCAENNVGQLDNNYAVVKKYECVNCQKTFSTARSLNRHVSNFCKKKDNEIELLQIINVLKNQLVGEKHKNKINTQTTGNIEISNNTAITNVTNNILINAYGNEDISHITDNDFNMMFTKCNSLIPMLFEMIHYNKDKPENTNVYISNIKSQYAYVYNGNKWILRNKNELIDDIYDNKCIIVIDKFDDIKKILNKNTIELFNKFIEKHDTDNMRKSASNKIELMLYNNRDLIKNK